MSTPTRRIGTKPIAAAMAAASILAFGLIQAPHAQALPGPGSIPVTITNDTGSDQPVHIYITAVDNTDADGIDNLGYVDAAGTYHAWPKATGATPVAAPDVSILAPTNGKSMTLHIPDNVSGRLYYSIGKKMTFRLVGTTAGTGLVQPAPWAPGDPSATQKFDWAEFTLNGQEKQYTGLWINSTQVDQVGLSAKVETWNSDGEHRYTGEFVPGGYQKTVDTLTADPAWSKTVVRDDSGNVLRILAPSHAATAGLFSKNYMDSYITKSWNQYKTTDYVVQPFSDQPTLKYIGRVGSDNIMRFTTEDGKPLIGGDNQQVAYTKPSTTAVLGCDGQLNGLNRPFLLNDNFWGPTSRTICSDLNRGVMDTSGIHPITDTSAFYKNADGLNLYAKLLHQYMDRSRAYAFAFDDVGGHESLVYAPQPTKAAITLLPLNDPFSTTTPEPTPEPEPTPDPEPEPEPAPIKTTTTLDMATMKIIWGRFSDKHPGYATLTMGAGTKPAILTIRVDGKDVSKAAISGPGKVRVDLPGTTGTVHKVTIVSAANMGPVSLTLPNP